MTPLLYSISKCFTPEIFATDEALKMVLSGKSFRDAYKEVGTHLSEVEVMNPADGITTRISTGTAGNLRLDKLDSVLTEIKSSISSQEKSVQKLLKELLSLDVKPFRE